jgi:hopanoid C-3 methylase
MGGHSAAAYPSPFLTEDIDALATGDGEQVVPLLADALEHRRSLQDVPGLWLRPTSSRDSASVTFEPASAPVEPFNLDDVPLPSRRHLDGWRSRYACLLYRPVWLVETARGCPFRCSFCSVWPMYDRGVRLRSVESVCQDFAGTGPNLFIADDLFWYQPARSLELAAALKQRGIRKRWILVQSRTDLVARHPELLEAWRPVADIFDIFFGLEAATDEGLEQLHKDTTVNRTVEAVDTAREQGYGVTGNFVIDPDWEEADFERLWGFVERHALSNAGFTVLTPLPGTAYFEEVRPRIRAESWAQYDMHHLLWEPRLGVRRFFELYCETWRRSVLNLKGRKSWRDWARQVRPRDLPLLTRTLLRSQRMMRPAAYVAEHRLVG